MDFLKNQNGNVVISSEKKEITLNDNQITVDGMVIDFPGEYEKSGILIQVKEENEKLYFTLQVEGKIIAFVPHAEWEIHDELINFFWKASILITLADKVNTKLVEVLEPLLIVPYGEGKDVFLSSLGQSAEPTDRYKVKELDLDGAAVYVNLI